MQRHVRVFTTTNSSNIKNGKSCFQPHVTFSIHLRSPSEWKLSGLESSSIARWRNAFLTSLTRHDDSLRHYYVQYLSPSVRPINSIRLESTSLIIISSTFIVKHDVNSKIVLVKWVLHDSNNLRISPCAKRSGFN